jgi:hypothetical protein
MRLHQYIAIIAPLLSIGCGTIDDTLKGEPTFEGCVEPAEEYLACDEPEDFISIDSAGQWRELSAQLLQHICASGCNAFSGTLEVVSGSRTFLEPLDGVRRAHRLLLEGTRVADLSFFGGLQAVDAELKVLSAHELTDLRGLESLVSVGADQEYRLIALDIQLNRKLRTLRGLESLTFIGNRAESLQVLNNPALKEVQLDKLRHVEGSLNITANPVLEVIAGMNELEEIGLNALDGHGTFAIGNNEQLRRITGFQSLRKVKGNVIIRNNPRLSGCDVERLLNQLTEVGGQIIVSGNGPATDCP